MTTPVQQTQRWQEAKKLLGLCICCGWKKVKKDRTKCRTCLNQLKIETKIEKRKRRKNNRCTGCNKQLHRNSKYLECGKCRSKGWIKQKRANSKLRDDVFNAYGGYTCKCCEETEECFLTIDHLNNRGWLHRKRLKHRGAGSVFYGWLRKKKFPPGYQVLCWNCQWGKRKRGICPHQTKLDKTQSVCYTPNCKTQQEKNL